MFIKESLAPVMACQNIATAVRDPDAGRAANGKLHTALNRLSNHL
jgi:hypothetical protein